MKNAAMKDHGHGHEKAEEENLDHEAPNDDPLSRLCGVWLFLGEDTCSGRLYHEGEDIAKYEDCREKPSFYRRLRFSVNQQDYVTKLHVNAGCEQDWGNEQEEGLDDVWS